MNAEIFAEQPKSHGSVKAVGFATGFAILGANHYCQFRKCCVTMQCRPIDPAGRRP